ncbi:activator of HSP90 ATPase [Mesorhizobium loti R88b]|uniref:Activator of HSP90 ATPase n=1 Tax=Mesorhizobium loti R88b TaxID=935548 RepID=A0A6M7WBB1_RHILI|nr:activator of HSP90 ATPase [Mesorhizobium loti R88b]
MHGWNPIACCGTGGSIGSKPICRLCKREIPTAAAAEGVESLGENVTDQSIEVPSDDPAIIIARTFEAPRALMFKLFTDPYHLVRFWGPEGSTYPVCEMDVRPGGEWRLTMRFADGSEYPTNSVYLEITPPERIVYRDAPLDRSQWQDSLAPAQMVTTIQFEDVGGKTRIVATVRANSIDARDMAVKMGFGQMVMASYARLETYLTTL